MNVSPLIFVYWAAVIVFLWAGPLYIWCRRKLRRAHWAWMAIQAAKHGAWTSAQAQAVVDGKTGQPLTYWLYAKWRTIGD